MAKQEQFGVGDYMVYGTVGVCQVKEVAKLDFMANDKVYYSLVPVFDKGGTIYIPVDNEKVLMRKVITKEAATACIEHLPEVEVEDYTNRNERLQVYREKLLSGDSEQWAEVVKGMASLSEDKKEKGRGLTINENENMKMAENLLFGELAIVLGMSIEEVPAYIEKKLNR